MKIESIRFGMLRVPLITPFKTSLRTVDEIADVVVMVETDTGHRGYGSAPATAVITGETHGSIIEAMRVAGFVDQGKYDQLSKQMEPVYASVANDEQYVPVRFVEAVKGLSAAL